MKNTFLIILLIFFASQNIKSQNNEYARKIIKTLSSEKYQGRGYDENGNNLAAKFLAKEFKKLKLNKFEKSYIQKFILNTNSLNGNMLVIVDNDTLIPGNDFTVKGYSCSISGKYKVVVLDKKILNNKIEYKKIVKKNYSDKIILIDTFGFNNDKKVLKNKYSFMTMFNSKFLNAKAIIEISEKTQAFVPAQQQKASTNIVINRNNFNNYPDSITIEVDAKQLYDVKTQNIIGFIKGKTDSFIVFSAHYDHIGKMGENIYFPGANDNASGVAMVLSLAKYYSQLKEPPKHSIVFMLFSGEELGLLGSKYYTENPIFPLSKIKFLFNLDMVGSGDKGIQIVNSTVFKNEYNILKTINDDKKYLPQLKLRGAAANSDHYFFYAKGVKSFFIYTLGEYKEYHNIYDTAENLPLNKFNELMNLLIDFEKYTLNN